MTSPAASPEPIRLTRGYTFVWGIAALALLTGAAALTM